MQDINRCQIEITTKLNKINNILNLNLEIPHFGQEYIFICENMITKCIEILDPKFNMFGCGSSRYAVFHHVINKLNKILKEIDNES